MFSSRRARVATLIAAGVIGFGGVAAAGGGGGLDLTDLSRTPVVNPKIEDEDEDEVEEIEVEVEEIEDEGSDDDSFTEEIAKITPAVVAAAPADDAAAIKVTCVEGGNHGETVSAVARNAPGFEDVEVRDAAHSDCGKTDDDATKVDDEDDDDVEDDADNESVEDAEDDSDADSDADADADADADDGDEDEDEDAARGSKGDRGSQGNGNRGKSGDDD